MERGRTTFEITVRVGDVRAEDDRIKKPARCLLALVELELLGRVLEHASEERSSRTATRAIKYQNSFVRLPVVPSATDYATCV